MIPSNWMHWQREVLQLLRNDFLDAFQHLRLEEVDWISWRRFYEEGRTPRSAIDRALERDL